MIDIAVIIVNYKMKTDIEKCLVSLFADCKEDALNVHVTVVDNCSSDGIDTFLKARFPEVKCIMQSENKGFGAAQNVGLISVDATYYLILNPDTQFKPGEHTLKRLFNFMNTHPKVGLCAPKIVYPDGSLQYSCYRFPTFWQPLFSRTALGERGLGKRLNDHVLMKDFDHTSTQAVDWVMGSVMFVRAAALYQVGNFDERFWMYYEDSDLCRRMWEAGWPVYYVSDTIVAHSHGRGSARVPGIIASLIKNKLARTHVRSWLKYMWKWRDNYRFYARKIS